MDASATFTTRNFKPATVNPDTQITTGLPVSVSTLEKAYAGDIEGLSSTVFTAAFDPASRTGSYIAIESFQGAVNGKQGAFNFIHSASTTGADRADEFFCIVAGSGTGELQGVSGAGGIAIDADGTHRIWLDYQIAQG
ncbi:TPA: DUF3224 domain-containing protein [Pseudomonas putida]|nr:DUF3224 domain-containing protein [Pseudomonas putida]